jgi:hypothetical protein
MKWKTLLIACLASAWPSIAMAIEEPKYQVLEKDGDIELRAYEPMIVAEVLVDGDMDRASGKGFRMIAGYIFGDNTSQSGAEEKIAMTAPVTMSPSEEQMAEKIAMTAPVTMQETEGQSGEQWRVHFVMPSEYTMASLPNPNDERVKLREVEAAKYASIRFSGLVGEKKHAAKIQELHAWMAAKGLKPKSEPELARYNPPWTIPFMRRNEILIRY